MMIPRRLCSSSKTMLLLHVLPLLLVVVVTTLSSSSFAFVVVPRSSSSSSSCHHSFFLSTTTTKSPTTTATHHRRLWHLSNSSSSNNSSPDSTNNDDNKNVEESSTTSTENEQQQQQRTVSFDQAGASLMEEEDRKRMEEMGDFDLNPAYKDDSIEQMRAAIRERTSAMGLEKSKVSADYIQSKQAAAMAAGSAQAAREAEASAAGDTMFGGLDLSKITSDGKSRGEWDEDMPTMFYEPEAEMSMEEQEEVDPLMTKNPVEQGLNELRNAKWPTLAAAGREVLVMAAVVAFSAVLIIGADKVLRALYTNLDFIPSADDLANYASRFDGLDLPSGWTDNMNENDVAEFTEKVSSVVPMPTPSSSGSGGLPGL